MGVNSLVMVVHFGRNCGNVSLTMITDDNDNDDDDDDVMLKLRKIILALI